MAKGKAPRAIAIKAPRATTAATPQVYVDGTQLQNAFDGLGFERFEKMSGSTFQDCSTVIIVPTREDKFHHRIVQSWQNLIAPMNQKRAFMYCIGDEVGVAYTRMVQAILANPELSKWKYVMTLETDNVIPMDAHMRLIESIEEFKLDGISAIYFTKGEINMPMAYGDPEKFRQTGVLDFPPLDIRHLTSRTRPVTQALPSAAQNSPLPGGVVEVNGIAMGCSLYRMQLFRDIASPWFVTVNDVVEGKGAQGFTQDLYFCQRARQAGKRFGVDTRVRVGHLDERTGVVY